MTTDNNSPESNQEPGKELNPNHTPATLSTLPIKYRITGDSIAKATESLPDEQRHLIRWLDEYGRSHNLSLTEIGSQLKKNKHGDSYSGSSVYAAMMGLRSEQGASLNRFCEAVDQLRLRTMETSASRSTLGTFIKTDMSSVIFNHAARNFAKNSMSAVWGESQIGKTRTEEELCRIANLSVENKKKYGQMCLIYTPTKCGYGKMLAELAIQRGISPQTRGNEVPRRIIDSFDDKMHICVDEAHKCLRTKFSATGLDALDFIREIHDRRKTTVTFFATHEMRNEMLNGPHARRLRQILLRFRVPPIELPSIPSVQDRAKFSAAYGLSPAPDRKITVSAMVIASDGSEKKVAHSANPLELETAVLTRWGLGRWLAVLDEAREIAESMRKTISWGMVITAHAKFEVTTVL